MRRCDGSNAPSMALNPCCLTAEALQAATWLSASTIPSTTSSTRILSSPSPITRITGSVPDGRMIRRPLRPAAARRRRSRNHLGMFQRLAVLIADVLEDLRQRIETVADFRHRPVVLLDHRQNLQCGDEAVAGGGVVRQDDVAGRLAAEIVAVLAHMLEHVAVAHRRADQFDALPFEMPLEPEIGHHGADDAGLRQPVVFLPAFRDHRHQLVAIDDAPALVHDDHAVGVAIERDADIGAHLHHLAAQRLRRGGAAILVDVEAVGFDADGEDLGAELPRASGATR